MNYESHESHESHHKHTVCSLLKSVYERPLINNVERGTYVEHMIVLALGKQWSLTWPWASWDIQHRDGARIEVKQSAARQPWHERPEPPPGAGESPSPRLPPPCRGRFGINKPSEGCYLKDGTYEKTPLQRHADIYVFAWHPVEDLKDADHRRPDQWEFFVIPEKRLPPPPKDAITPGQLLKLDGAVRYKELAENVDEVRRKSLGSLKAKVHTIR